MNIEFRRQGEGIGMILAQTASTGITISHINTREAVHTVGGSSVYAVLIVRSRRKARSLERM